MKKVLLMLLFFIFMIILVNLDTGVIKKESTDLGIGVKEPVREQLTAKDIDEFLIYAKKNDENWYSVVKKGYEIFEGKYINDELIEKKLRPYQKDKGYVLYEKEETVYWDVESRKVELSINSVKDKYNEISLECKKCDLENYIKIYDRITSKGKKGMVGGIVRGKDKAGNVSRRIESSEKKSVLENSTAMVVECGEPPTIENVIKLLKNVKQSVYLWSEFENDIFRRIQVDALDKIKILYPVNCAVIQTKSREIKINYYIVFPIRNSKQDIPKRYEALPYRLLVIYEGNSNMTVIKKHISSFLSVGGRFETTSDYELSGIGDLDSDGYHNIIMNYLHYGGSTRYAINLKENDEFSEKLGSIAGWD